MLSDFYNSSIYKSAGQVDLTKAYYNNDFQPRGKLYYFNNPYYKKIMSDKNEDYKLYAKTSEYKFGDYVTSGIRIYSLDKDYKDDSKIILCFPYLQVNPRLKITNIRIRDYDNFLSTNMEIDINISDLDEVEKEALKKANFSSFHIATFEEDNMYIRAYLSNYKSVEEKTITNIN